MKKVKAIAVKRLNKFMYKVLVVNGNEDGSNMKTLFKDVIVGDIRLALKNLKKEYNTNIVCKY